MSDAFESLIQALPIPTLLVDGELKIINLNTGLRRLFELSHDKPIEDLEKTFENQKPLAILLKKKLASINSNDEILQFKASFKDEQRKIEILEVMIKSLDFEQKLFVIHFLDRTRTQRIESRLKDSIQDQIRDEQKLREAFATLERLNKELKETQDQLIQAEKLQSIGQLATGVAHEVKNPLAIIVQGLEYLDRHIKADESSKEIIKDLNDAVQRADKVIRNLLDYASPQDVRMEHLDIHVPLNKALGLMNQLFKNHQIEVIKDYDESIAKIDFDENRLHQVFINIFSNALHAMENNGKLIVKTLKISDAIHGRLVKIVIKDDGPGINPNMIKRVFDPFVTGRRSEGGTGLGMSVVKGIIEMHHGVINIENSSEGGAIVTIEI